MVSLNQIFGVLQNAAKIDDRQAASLRVERGWVKAVYQCLGLDFVDGSVREGVMCQGDVEGA